MIFFWRLLPELEDVGGLDASCTGTTWETGKTLGPLIRSLCPYGRLRSQGRAGGLVWLNVVKLRLGISVIG